MHLLVSDDVNGRWLTRRRGEVGGAGGSLTPLHPGDEGILTPGGAQGQGEGAPLLNPSSGGSKWGGSGAAEIRGIPS